MWGYVDKMPLTDSQVFVISQMRRPSRLRHALHVGCLQMRMEVENKDEDHKDQKHLAF